MKKAEAAASFDKLYDATYDNALRYVVETAGGFNGAEDILAETYSAVYKRMLNSKKDEIDNIRGYFFTCLKNAVRKYRSGKADEELLYGDMAQDDCQEMIDALLSTDINVTESEAENHILLAKINDYLSQQNETQRRAFILRVYYGYPLQMVAEKTRLPQTTVNNYVYRLLNDIRQKFLEEYIVK